MDVCKIAIFLYCYVFIHFLSDFLNHWMDKNRGLRLLLLHSFLYTVFFIPLFWRLGVDFLWLILICFSHFVIDWQWDLLFRIVSKILRHENETKINLRFYTAAIDQVLHLCVPVIIVLYLISMP